MEEMSNKSWIVLKKNARAGSSTIDSVNSLELQFSYYYQIEVFEKSRLEYKMRGPARPPHFLIS
jgi:hypothetical protein